MNGELRWWLDQIGRHPLLTPAEELHLATMVQAWQHHPAPAPRRVIRSGMRARDRMVNANLRLVVNIAKKYGNRSIDLADLVQAGNAGLLRGVVKFDPSRGYKFSTYGYWWIRQGITRYLEENSRTIRHPSSFSQRIGQIDRATRQLICGLQRAPSVEELAGALGMKTTDLSLVLGRGQNCVSLDARMGGDADFDTLSAIVADPQSLTVDEQLERLAHHDQLEAMSKALAALPGRQQLILKRRWGLDGAAPCTIRAMAEQLGVNSTRMSADIQAAQIALRLTMAAQAPEPNQPSTIEEAAPRPGLHGNRRRSRWCSDPELSMQD